MKAMFMEGSSIFALFCNDGAWILHLNMVTLKVTVTRLQRVKGTNVEHTKP